MAKALERETTLEKTPIFDLLLVHNNDYPFDPVRIKSNDWVTVIVEKNDEFLMVSQLRYGINRKMTEFVSGIVDDGEYPYDAALRELREETGIVICKEKGGKLIPLGKSYANPAFMTNTMHYYLLNMDKVECDVVGQKLDKNEKLEMDWVKKSEIISMANSKTRCSSTFLTSALYFYFLNSNNKNNSEETESWVTI